MNDTSFSSVACGRILGRGGNAVRRGAVAASVMLILMLAGLAPPAARADDIGSTAVAEQTDASADTAPARGERCAADDVFVRTELFFGLSRPDGGVISEDQFKVFVDNRVTPQFPAGLTLLSGAGQFKYSTGTFVSEGSKVLILLYAADDPLADRRIDRIRRQYKAEFDQESVLRADDLSCVSF